VSDKVHPTAIVEDGARIGVGTAVWHHAHVRTGASVGEACSLGRNVFIDAGVVVGDRVKVQNNVSVYAGVRLGDEVFVGPSVVFTNDRLPRSTGAWALTPTIVHRGASIGGNATVVAGIEIGEWAMVGAGAVVVRSVAAHEVVVGNPAGRIGWVCRCGAVRVREGEGTTVDCAECGTRLELP
jgi:UDP-2-acetamido-3-amino-2,3-dideoxy-glucuronate N-acetyltransferase